MTWEWVVLILGLVWGMVAIIAVAALFTAVDKRS